VKVAYITVTHSTSELRYTHAEIMETMTYYPVHISACSSSKELYCWNFFALWHMILVQIAIIFVGWTYHFIPYALNKTVRNAPLLCGDAILNVKAASSEN
jgi:hypothetical protein